MISKSGKPKAESRKRKADEWQGQWRSGWPWPGVLFLKVTVFRRLLRTFKGEKFLTIQVTGDELLMGQVRLPLESNEMLLYPIPDQAPKVHPSVALSALESEAKPRTTSEKGYEQSWLTWKEPPVVAKKPESESKIGRGCDGMSRMPKVARVTNRAELPLR